uniref:Ovule protein n=1 Tax=Caenorhabditis tropicalis TaxID=1561998 RepID=A0A1I7TJZ3_9PELO
MTTAFTLNPHPEASRSLLIPLGPSVMLHIYFTRSPLHFTSLRLDSRLLQLPSQLLMFLRLFGTSFFPFALLGSNCLFPFLFLLHPFTKSQL